MKWLAYIDVFYFFFDIVRYIAAGRWYYSIMPCGAFEFASFSSGPSLHRFGDSTHQSKQATHFHNTVRAQQRQEQISAADAGLPPQMRRVRPHGRDKS